MALEINRVTDMVATLVPGRALIPHAAAPLPKPLGAPATERESARAPTENPPALPGDIDIHDASPRQIAAASLDLYAAGLLTFEDYQELAFQPELHPDYNRTVGALTGEPAQPDRRRDFVKVWNERLQFDLRHNPRDSTAVKQAFRIHDLLLGLGRASRLSV